MKSYWIKYITYYKGEEIYERENENIQYQANWEENPLWCWYIVVLREITTPITPHKVYDDRVIEELQRKIHILIIW